LFKPVQNSGVMFSSWCLGELNAWCLGQLNGAGLWWGLWTVTAAAKRLWRWLSFYMRMHVFGL
jgi:hypothetical protein